MYDKIYEALDNLSIEDTLRLWNDYAANNAPDDYIFGSLEELSEVFDSDTLTEFARRIIFGDVQNYNAAYWFVDGYANIVACDTLAETPLDIGALTEYVIDNPALIAEYGLPDEEDADEDE